MTLDFFSALPSSILATCVGLVAYIRKKDVDKIEKLEDRISQSVTESQVRQIVIDKIDPIKEDLTEIKDDMKSCNAKLDKLFDNQFQKYK